MRIVCPDCGYSSDVAESRIPAGNPRIVCPKCRSSFRLDSSGGPARENQERPRPASSAHQSGRSTLPDDQIRAGYAGFWIRVLAWALDQLLLGLIVLVFSLCSGLISGEGLYFVDRAEQLTVAMVSAPFSFLFATVFGYAYRVFFIGYCGQTPGKMAVGVKVVRTQKTEIGFGRAFLREVIGKFCSKIILGIGYLMVAFDSRKQGLHDKIADTLVIKLK